MTIVRRIANVVEGVVPDPAIRYAEDVVRGRRFDARARAYRDRYGLEVAERRLTVLAYPETIATLPRILFGRLCAALGYRVTALPTRRHNVAIKYHDATFTDPSVVSVFGSRSVINGGSLDISKRRVDQAFVEAFGVSSLVDPMTHVGPMVEKPNLNSKRGLGVIQGPASARQGFVYQRLVDSTTGDGHYIELRLPYHDGRFPFVYRKEVDVATRFLKETARVTIEPPEEYLTEKELEGVQQLCREMGVDFAELDVLRDEESGQAYVIDINNTPYGPLKGLSEEDHGRAIRILSGSFQQMCESRLDG